MPQIVGNHIFDKDASENVREDVSVFVNDESPYLFVTNCSLKR